MSSNDEISISFSSEKSTVFNLGVLMIVIDDVVPKSDPLVISEFAVVTFSKICVFGGMIFGLIIISFIFERRSSFSTFSLLFLFLK